MKGGKRGGREERRIEGETNVKRSYITAFIKTDVSVVLCHETALSEKIGKSFVATWAKNGSVLGVRP